MIYTVGEMAKTLGVPASTLRYYDKEGLLPFYVSKYLFTAPVTDRYSTIRRISQMFSPQLFP